MNGEFRRKEAIGSNYIKYKEEANMKYKWGATKPSKKKMEKIKT